MADDPHSSSRAGEDVEVEYDPFDVHEQVRTGTRHADPRREFRVRTILGLHKLLEGYGKGHEKFPSVIVRPSSAAEGWEPNAETYHPCVSVCERFGADVVLPVQERRRRGLRLFSEETTKCWIFRAYFAARLHPL